MAITWTVAPRAGLIGSTWTYELNVRDERDASWLTFTHIEPAGVTINGSLGLLKLVFRLITADTDTAVDIDNALFEDDIRPGPQVETVWGNWRDLAETIISALPEGFTAKDFVAAWRPQDTNAIRQDARRALINQRGWVIEVGSIHQHEGDGTTLIE